MAVIFLIYRQNVGRRRRLQILLLSVARKVQEQTVQSDRNVIDQPIQVPSPIPPVVVAKETSQWSNEKKKKKKKKMANDGLLSPLRRFLSTPTSAKQNQGSISVKVLVLTQRVFLIK